MTWPKQLPNYHQPTAYEPTTQGLAEVLAVLGTNHLEALLPQLLTGCADKTSASCR